MSITYPNGPIHLADADAYKYEPQRTNHFEVSFSGLDGNDELKLAVSTFSLPNITNDPIEIAHQNSRIKFAGQTTFAGAESLEVIDYIGADIESIVNAWRNLVYDPETDIMGLAANYKKDGYITEYAPDGKHLREWKLTGCFPSGVAFGDTLSMDGSDVKKITLTLSYDRAYRVKTASDAGV